MVKILHPIPNTCPSALYSIAGATTEFAKPVIGTSAPAPPHFYYLRVNTKASQQDTGQDQLHQHPGLSIFFFPFQGSSSSASPKPVPMRRWFRRSQSVQHVTSQFIDWSNLFDVFVVGFFYLIPWYILSPLLCFLCLILSLHPQNAPALIPSIIPLPFRKRNTPAIRPDFPRAMDRIRYCSPTAR